MLFLEVCGLAAPRSCGDARELRGGMPLNDTVRLMTNLRLQGRPLLLSLRVLSPST